MKLLVRLVVALVAISSSATFAAKPAPPPPPPSPGAACVGSTWAFPAMAYSRGVYSKSGAYQKTQIFVADAHGTCEVMVYDTGDYNGSDVEVSFHFESATGTGTLSWAQIRDNGERTNRYVIKVAQFSVVNRAVTGLPLTATTIYRAPTTSFFSIDDVELSPDASRLAFSTENGGINTTGSVTDQVLICTLMACPSTLEVAFTRTITTAADQSGGTHRVTIGHNENDLERIYFIYRPNAAWSDGDLVAVDNDGGTWTAPVVMVNRDVSYIGDTDTFLDQPSALSRPGVSDRVLIWSRAALNSGQPRIDVYDAGSSSLTPFVGTGYRPSWTLAPSIDLGAPNVLVSQMPPSTNGAIQEIDLDGQVPETSLPVQGYAVDSAN